MTKKQAQKLFTAYKNGTSKLELDRQLGSNRRGKTVTALFENKLSVRTFGNGKWEPLSK